MRIQIRQPAAEHERFAPGAFDSVIGGEFSFTGEGGQAGTGRLAAAEIAGDGRSALLTLDIPDDASFAAGVP